MTGRNIFRNLHPYSDDDILTAIGGSIGKIKAAGRYNWHDMSRFFGGKNKDMVAKYNAGASDMPVTAFIAAAQSFGPAFMDAALNIIGYRAVPTYFTCTEDAPKVRTLADLIGDLAEIIGDGIEDRELVEKAAGIEKAGEVIDELRSRLYAAQRVAA